MGKFLDRITELAEKESITIGALERKIGASKGCLSRAIANGTDIQAKWLENIVENYPYISAEWLLRGEGAMLRTVADAADNAPNSESVKFSGSQSTEPLVADLITKIATQAEEIGRLKERMEEPERHRGGDAGHAQNSGNANVG